MEVIKASGERERYSTRKFQTSLKQAGVPVDVRQKVARTVERRLKSEPTSEEVYREAHRQLTRVYPRGAAKYHLKRGIMQLGPSGYYFEHYLAAVLEAYGYIIHGVGQEVRGKCVQHEIDVNAEKRNVHYFVEAKYHNTKGIKTHTPTVMYHHARMLDIAEAHERDERFSYDHKAWLITNTKFTGTAIKYGRCNGIKLTGWHYPHGRGLEYFIEAKNLYPVTVLQGLKRHMRESLAQHNIVLAKDLVTMHPKKLRRLMGVSGNIARRLITQAADLCNERT